MRLLDICCVAENKNAKPDMGDRTADSPTLASGRTRATLVCAEGMGTGDLRADSRQLALIRRCLREREGKKEGR